MPRHSPQVLNSIKAVVRYSSKNLRLSILFTSLYSYYAILNPILLFLDSSNQLLQTSFQSFIDIWAS